MTSFGTVRHLGVTLRELGMTERRQRVILQRFQHDIPMSQQDFTLGRFGRNFERSVRH